MKTEIIDSLTDIGYQGPLLDVSNLTKAIDGGAACLEYTNLVHTLSLELKDLYNLEEVVSKTTSPEDSDTFLLELSSFLREINCPYVSLMTGQLSNRLQNETDKMLLLDFLLSELMTARMLAINKPQEIKDSMDITIHETPTAKDLNEILTSLKMTQPPANIPMNILFDKLKAKLQNTIQQQGPNYVGRPLYNKTLSEKEWKDVEIAHKQLCDEYKLRRETLITRLDCTVQSFEWSDNGTKKRENIQSIYRPLRNLLKSTPSIKLSDFLASRTDLLTIKKTSDASVRLKTKSDVNKVLIGRVPDRGGRPSEQQAPPPEVPSWQQQKPQRGNFGRGGGGGSGFGRGGVQGGWNPSGDNRNNQGRGGGNNYQDNRSFQDNNRGFQDNNRSFQDNNRSFQDNNRSFQDNGRGYQDNRGFQDNKGFQDNRKFQDNRNQNDNRKYQERSYQNSSRNYQSQDRTFQDQNPQSFNQGQNKGRYQNEHDNRGNSGGGRGGRSNYFRGGRN